MIYTFIPYASREHHKDLGWCYNEFMNLLPHDDDWACFVDHDAMFTTRNWYQQLNEIVSAYENVGCFTAMTNRIGNPAQVHHYRYDMLQGHDNRLKRHFELLEINHGDHDIGKHRQIGQNLFDEKYVQVKELDLKNPMSGVLILVKKSTWRKVKFRSGFLGVDRSFHKDCLSSGYRVLLMEGVYLYHWYRGDGDLSHIEEYFTPKQ